MTADWLVKDHGTAGKSWIHPGAARLNVVFVHGFQGDHLATWTFSKREGLLPFVGLKESASLFDLLRDDGDLIPCNYFSVGHRARIRTQEDLESAGGLVVTFLRDYVPSPETRAPIVLIAHSFGGLACRVAILSLLRDLGDDLPIVGLMMMGTPNTGTEIARAASALGAAAGDDMRPFDLKLAELNRRWSESVVNGGDPNLDPAQRASLLCWSVVGTVDDVVPRASAAALASFSTIEYVPKGHIDLVKARNRDDATYAVIARFIRKAEAASRQRDGERAIAKLTYGLRRASLAGRWVVDEEERIRLESEGDPSRLRCTVSNVRMGGLASRSFNVGVWLTGYRPAGTIDYEWEIGQGILTKQNYARFTGAGGSGFDQYFSVTALSVRQNGRNGDFTAKGSTKDAASTVLHFEAPEWFREDEPVESLSLSFTAIVDRARGGCSTRRRGRCCGGSR